MKEECFYSVDAFSKMLRSSPHLLYLLSNQTSQYYRIYKIPKKNGKYRIIEAPEQPLKSIQKVICNVIFPSMQNVFYKKNFLDDICVGCEKIDIPAQYRIARAFEKKSSILNNAAPHIGKPVILALDVKDFFPSLKYSMVLDLFRKSGFAPACAVLLAKLCTFKGHVPQGAVTSPQLSNLLLAEFDFNLSQYCEAGNISVTRYADDLTFSGNLSDVTITDLIRYCRSHLKEYGLRLNSKKIRVLRNGGRQEVTGIVVNEKPNVSRTERRFLRQKMYYLNKYWGKEWNKLDEHTLNVLLGKINFTWSIDRGNAEFSEYRRQLLEIKHFSNFCKNTR